MIKYPPCTEQVSLVVTNVPCNAGFDPWSGKIPRATEQLSPCAKTTESVL